MHLLSYALRFLKHYFRPRVYLQLPARARYSFGTLLVRFIAHGIEEKMALLPNLFYIKGDGLDRRGSATGIVNSSNFRCQTIKRYGKISLSRFPKLCCFGSWTDGASNRSRAWTSPRPSSETRNDIDLPVLSEKWFQNMLNMHFRGVFCSPVIV